ncbi:MAG: hypothetical protein ACI9NT_000908 [Bacteroidia bacterium]|jgi:hypothetical protein
MSMCRRHPVRHLVESRIADFEGRVVAVDNSVHVILTVRLQTVWVVVEERNPLATQR